MVCARSLRTQQRAESQCQKAQPPALEVKLERGIPLVQNELETSSFWDQRSIKVEASTESLILAQDERWRRA